MVLAVAHDARNDLQRALANVRRAASRSQDRPEVTGLLDGVELALGDLGRRFDDLLCYTAPVRLEPRECDLAQVWRSAWARVIAVHEGGGAALEEDLGGTSTACVGDPFRLGAVFVNLFTNALEACTGPARVTVSCREANPRGAALRVAARDNGPGLTPRQRLNLFRPFFTTKQRGTGLGLAISRQAVEAQGGTLEATGDGPGAEFALTLPRGAGKRPGPPSH